MKRLLLSPGLHFFILGLACWLVLERFSVKTPEINIEPSLNDVELRSNMLGLVQVGKEGEAEAGVAQLLREENLLFLYGLSNQFHRNDDVIKKRLLKNLAFISGKECKLWCDEQAIDLGLHLYDPVIRARVLQLVDLQLRNSVRLAGHKFYTTVEKSLQSELFTFRHCYFSFGRTNEDVLLARNTAESQLKKIRGAGTCQDADVFYQGERFGLLDQQQLARIFGEDFAKAITSLEEGEWQGVLTSAYGFHLVYLEDRQKQQEMQKTAVVSKPAMELYDQLRQGLIKQTARKYGYVL